jgi:hypothetical protein
VKFKLKSFKENLKGGVVVAIAICIFAMVLFIFGTAALLISSINQQNAFNQAQPQLEEQGYRVVQGSINSPTVVQITSDYYYFIHSVPLNLTVYSSYIGTNQAYVAIFNDSYGLAYEPSFPIG